MICDSEFWVEARRKHERGNSIFTVMLSLLHARQTIIDPYVDLGKNTTDGAVVQEGPVVYKPKSRSSEVDGALSLPGLKIPARPVSPSVVRVLQQVMMFAVPLYSLRYRVPAMSMSWKTSCVLDSETKQLMTFGAGSGVNVPENITCRGCVATDQFFAVLTDQNEVWASGGLHVLVKDGHGWVARPLGKESTMTHVANDVLMLAGHGTRLACLTRSLIVRSLSILSNPVSSLIPLRRIRFLDLGYGDDYYMVGIDSSLYKTLASRRTLGTPRRVMVFSRTAVSRVACGTGFYLIIDENGQLLSVGRNKKGQLGYEQKQRQGFSRKPYLHNSLRHHFFVMVAAGESHSLALTSSGVVYGAGSNENGQLGLGESLRMVLLFTPIPLPSKCVGIAAGPMGSMFACKNGRVYVCGLNDYKQLGIETKELIVYTPSPIPRLAAGVESYIIDFGTYHRPLFSMHEPFSLSTPQALSSSFFVTENGAKSMVSAQSLPSAQISNKTNVVKPQKLYAEVLHVKKKMTCVKCCVVV